MTDDEIHLLLKPKHNWTAILGALAGAAGIAWGVARWAATTPTRDEFNQTRDSIVQIRIELPTINAKLERAEQSQQRIEKAVEQMSGKLDERRSRGR